MRWVAKVFQKFVARGTFPTKADLAVNGITNPTELVKCGWIIAPAGRFAISYQPAQPVMAMMETLVLEHAHDYKGSRA